MADVFRGNNPTRVDEKGRLKMPADFKRLVDEQAGPRFYITSLDGKRAQLYPIKEWEMKEAMLAKLPAFNPARMKFQDVTSYYGQVAEMDAQGRLLLPQILREEAKLTGEVVVLGKTGTLEPGFLEVVNHDIFKAEMKQTPLSLADLETLAALGM
jgi:MraZ protein